MTETTLIFTYGTLKQGFPNYFVIQDLIHNNNNVVHLGTYTTHNTYPLVCGPHGIPYLINLPGSGHRVKGQLYSLSTREGLARIDQFEGTSRGHYERLPIKVYEANDSNNGNGGVVLVEAEAYFADRSFGEELWERNGRQGLSEFSEREAKEYVRVQDRPQGSDILGDIRLFLSSKD